MNDATTNAVALPLAPDQDVRTDLLRQGATQLLAQAIQAEVAAYLDAHSDVRDPAGRQQVVRNGYLPQRTILTGLGPVEVKQPRVQDRRPPDQREQFSSAILPPYLRKTKSIEELIPWLYLKGVSTGDFSEALAALLGPQAKGLSAATVTRLKSVWAEEYQTWSKRSLAGKHSVYVWADGVHFNIRLEDDRQCILVLLGATADGRKELIALADGYWASEQSWAALLLDCQRRRSEVHDPVTRRGGRRFMPSDHEPDSPDFGEALFPDLKFAENPEPRVPCVLLLDNSGSMDGNKIRLLNEGLVAFRDDVTRHSLAAKRAEIAVITFGGEVKVLHDFVTADEFRPPVLEAKGLTPMGAGILRALDLIEVMKQKLKAIGVS
jgi:hypothetical protein